VDAREVIAAAQDVIASATIRMLTGEMAATLIEDLTKLPVMGARPLSASVTLQRRWSPQSSTRRLLFDWVAVGDEALRGVSTWQALRAPCCSEESRQAVCSALSSHNPRRAASRTCFTRLR